MKLQNNTLRIAGAIFLSLLAFFLFMKLLGLERMTELRVFNLLIVIYFSNRLVQLNYIDDDKVDYVQNLFSILGANLLAVFASTIAVIGYIQLIDSGLIHAFENQLLWGSHLNLFQIFVGLLLEGMSGSMIVAFGIMQYWKNHKRVRRTLHLKRKLEV